MVQTGLGSGPGVRATSRPTAQAGGRLGRGIPAEVPLPVQTGGGNRSSAAVRLHATDELVPGVNNRGTTSGIELPPPTEETFSD